MTRVLCRDVDCRASGMRWPDGVAVFANVGGRQ
jgi:hypothetical protein